MRMLLVIFPIPCSRYFGFWVLGFRVVKVSRPSWVSDIRAIRFMEVTGHRPHTS